MSDLSKPLPMHTADHAPGADANPAGRWEFAHALLFTGHMIDSGERTPPRFPAWAEHRARHAIREAIAGVVWARPGMTIGLAGAASGGDLLFQEVCAELGVPTRVLLALPAAEFVQTSVAPAGPAWVDRFRALVERTSDLQVMGPQNGLLEGETENVWQRCNLWMIEQAVALAPEQALLALWDGKAGDGPGGTEHFVTIARKFGIRIISAIDMRTLVRS